MEFKFIKPFGPSVLKVKIPNEIINELNNYIDQIIKDQKKKELLNCIENVLKLGHLVMTPELAKFENNVCNYTKAKHCIGLNSGTDALMMALMCAGVKKNDEVITTPISFVATTGAIAHIGAKPIYVDTGKDLNIDPELIEKAITIKTKAIVPVHWSGKIAEMDSIMKISI